MVYQRISCPSGALLAFRRTRPVGSPSRSITSCAGRTGWIRSLHGVRGRVTASVSIFENWKQASDAQGKNMDMRRQPWNGVAGSPTMSKEARTASSRGYSFG